MYFYVANFHSVLDILIRFEYTLTQLSVEIFEIKLCMLNHLQYLILANYIFINEV